MGVYYCFVNDVTKERIDLKHVGSGNIKWSATACSDAGRLYAYLVLTCDEGVWCILSDCSNERKPRTTSDLYASSQLPTFYESKRAYLDVTKEAIDDFNENCGDGYEPIRYRNE